MDNVVHIQNCIIQAVNDPEASSRDIGWDVLRIDRIHPVVSGNKWFKLAPYLVKARQAGYRGLLSFGGAWSNHLHALAFAAREAGLSSLGLVRGEEPPTLSRTLADAREMGMELLFLPRKTYAALSRVIDHGSMENALQEILAAAPPSPYDKKITWSDYLLIPEGGYGLPGMEGAAGIWSLIPQDTYTHLLCAVGTGTMMAGLITGAGHSTGVIGIPVLRNESSLEADIRALLPPVLKDEPIHLNHQFHGGGYAKTSGDQLAFMSSFYEQTGIPTDIIYTSKLMRAAFTLMREGYFPQKSRVLVIHSGGLQGNRSLKMGILPF